MSGLGIYIHIPFCKKKCDYCDFYSVPCSEERTLDRYVDALIQQFEDYFPKGHAPEVDTVYLGGGTPSLLGGKRIAKLIKALDKRVTMKYPEITVEANPESCDKALFKQLARCGVNRVSMGVQSADNDELKSLGRLHSFEQAAQAVELCKAYCTRNISLDLIYGLPGQTLEGMQSSLESLISLGPTHISCYSLQLEEGTPLARRKPQLPLEDLQADMYLYLVQRLRECGYAQYEISNFAKDGYRSRNNAKYWDLSEYLGFGCSAHSFYGGKRFSFVRDIKSYLEGIQGNKPIVEEADELSFGNRNGEYVMLKLRTVEGIDEDAFTARFGQDFALYASGLEPYYAEGYVEKHSGVYRLTPKGFLISNRIIGDVLESGCSGNGAPVC